MNLYNDKIKLDAFRAKTTYLDDYRAYSGPKTEITRPDSRKTEPVLSPPKNRHFEDHQTFCRWRDDVYIPFNLLHYPKPIIQTDPRKPFVKLAPLPENDKYNAVKTRPRIYMTPACSIDDIPDPEMRKLLCNYMYTTEWGKAEKEGASGFTLKVPIMSRKETRDTVRLQTDLYPALESRFIATGQTWDDTQRRGSSDPTRDFWINKDPPVLCGACVNPLQNIVPQEIKQEISKSIKEDRLRLAHDKVSSSYAGYRPRLPNGVTISRKDLPVTHPMLTTSQVITSRYAENSRK